MALLEVPGREAGRLGIARRWGIPGFDWRGAVARRFLQHAGVYAFLVAAAAVVLLPYYWMLTSSLAPGGQTFSAGLRFLPEEVRWQNYLDVLLKYHLDRWLLNSTIVAVFETAGVLVTSILAGYAFGRLRFWGRDALFFVYLATLMIPGQVTLIPSFLVIRYLGLINTYQGLIIPKLCGFFGVFLMRQFFLSFPPELEDAACIDGSGRLRTLWQIVLPLSRPAVAALSIFAFTGSWNDFLWPLVVVGSERLKTVQLGLAAMKSETTDWGLLMAAAVLSALPLLVLYALLQRHFIRGITTTGLKA